MQLKNGKLRAASHLHRQRRLLPQILILTLKKAERKRSLRKGLFYLIFFTPLITKYSSNLLPSKLLNLSSSKKRARSEEGEIPDSADDEAGKVHPLVSVTKIDPDEIPEVPANKFLYRAGSANNANQKEFRQRFGRERNRGHTKSGRIIKGRGVFVCILYSILLLILWIFEILSQIHGINIHRDSVRLRVAVPGA